MTQLAYYVALLQHVIGTAAFVGALAAIPLLAAAWHYLGTDLKQK
jgi:hypothetical protein